MTSRTGICSRYGHNVTAPGKNYQDNHFTISVANVPFSSAMNQLINNIGDIRVPV